MVCSSGYAQSIVHPVQFDSVCSGVSSVPKSDSSALLSDSGLSPTYVTGLSQTVLTLHHLHHCHHQAHRQGHHHQNHSQSRYHTLYPCCQKTHQRLTRLMMTMTSRDQPPQSHSSKGKACAGCTYCGIPAAVLEAEAAPSCLDLAIDALRRPMRDFSGGTVYP